MAFFTSLSDKASRRTFLVFFMLSSILPLLIMILLIYQYIIPLLIPEQINSLINVFSFGFAAILFISILSFYLMLHRISSLEALAKEIKTRAPVILETKAEPVSENEIEALRKAFNNLSTELVWKVEKLKEYSESMTDYNRKLSSLAVIDKLTSLYNRRKFESTIIEECNRAERYKHELSLIMIDINKFKLYNDAYGHQTGDIILQKIGEVFRESIRKTDIPFRYGGDEFAILLPETSKEQAEEVSAKLKNMISHHQFVDANEPFMDKLSLSCGISCYCQDQGIDSFIKEADIALYKNKNSNCSGAAG